VKTDLEIANERVKELSPHARVIENRLGRESARFRVVDRLTLSLDGTTENGVAVEAILAESYTVVGALEKYHNLMHDKARQVWYRDRHLRGEDMRPPPPTEEERKRDEEIRDRLDAAREANTEAMRRHLHWQLKATGYYDEAVRYHKKTGKLALLFRKGDGRRKALGNW